MHKQQGISYVRSSPAFSAVSVVFDEPNLIADAGLVPLVRLAEQFGLPALVEDRLRIEGTDNSAGANRAAKVMTLVAAMCAGADSIDDTDRLRRGAMGRPFGGVRAPSTLGTFLRAFTHGHNRQPCRRARARFSLTVRTNPHVAAVIAAGKNSALAHLPSGSLQASNAWLTLWVIAHNLLRAAGALAGTFHARATTGPLRDRLIHVPARVARSARRLTLHLPGRWPWQHVFTDLFDATGLINNPTTRPTGPDRSRRGKAGQTGGRPMPPPATPTRPRT
ncbi:hypothetical protein GCM10010519_24190 [Streptomyces lactacystinicus]